MATLIKRPGSRFWIAAFDVPQPDGSVRRMKKSTKRTKRSEASIEAIRLEEVECKVGNSSGESASKAYTILAEAASAAAKGELSEARARQLLARLCEVSTGETLRFYTVRTWASDWLAAKAATGKKATQDRYKGHIESFLVWLGPKADEKLESITKADVRAFRDQIREGWTESRGKVSVCESSKHPSNRRTAATTNQYASDVAGMFRAATREGLLLASPCAALERLVEDDSTEREVFNIAEVGLLVEVAGDHSWQDALFSSRTADEEDREARSADWQGMILTGFYGGPRIGDCAKLSVGNVDLGRKSLKFMPAKTDRKRKHLEVPLHPRLLAYLKPRVENTEKDSPLFPTLVKTRPGGQHGLSSQFIAIMEAAGIDRGTKRQGTKGGQRAQHSRSFHSLRHSLTSTLANADVSEEIRRRIVGHESAEVHSGYTHHERETLARAVEKMPFV